MNTRGLRAKANAGRAFPSGVFSRDASKVTGPGENKPFSPYDGWQSPTTAQSLGLKQHRCAEEREIVNTASDL